MEIVKDIALVLHFIGLASLIGSFLVQAKASRKKVDPAMLHGALTQLVTGLVLVGVDQSLGDAVDNTKIGVKLLVLLVIGVIVVRKRTARSISTVEWAAIGGLTILNVVIAVVW